MFSWVLHIFSCEEQENIKEHNDNDVIAEDCVTARSETAMSNRPTSANKSVSNNQQQDMSSSRTSLKEKTEDLSGSRKSLLSKDEVLHSSRRSSRSNTKDLSISKKDLERESQSSRSPDKNLGSNTSFQNIPDAMGSNVSLTSASALNAKNGKMCV